jgi:hypothetical protein
MRITIGADPEFFLSHEGKIVSAYGLIEGTKENPTPVERGAVQVDGMALEFNIDPATSSEEFVRNIDTVLYELRKMIPKDYDFSFIASNEFDKKYLAEQPLIARRLGCDPDYNAWTEAQNPPPDENTSLRTAAGHVHIGWTEGKQQFDLDHFRDCCRLVKQLDCYLGIYSVLVDDDIKRRGLYGMAGAFRPKPYGVEYRVLSNFWLKNRATMTSVFEYTDLAINKFLADEYAPDILAEKGYNVQGIINNSDFDQAAKAFGELI